MALSACPVCYQAESSGLAHSQGVYAKMKQYAHCEGGAGMCRLLQGLSQHGPCQACRDVVDIRG